MRTAVEKILKMSSKEAKAPENSFLICNTYSKLFKNGRICRTCISARTQYFREFQLFGLKKLKEMEAPKTYKLVNGRNGIGITRINDAKTPHVVLSNLSDERTIELLTSGAIKENWYTEFPEGYKESEEPKADEVPVEVEKKVKKATKEAK